MLSLIAIFTIVGAPTTVFLFLNLLYKLYHFLKVRVCGRCPDFNKYGTWSVITGSTDGIGKAIAFQLASKGQNIILIARNEDKLKSVADEIAAKHGVIAKYLKVDFSHDESIYKEVKNLLATIDIGVLVNNVGIASPHDNFLDIPNLSLHIRDIIRINICSLVKMHEIVLPDMVRRKRGLIINVSSGTALKPMFPIYGASKAFVDHFSTALSYEYENTGVRIQSCLPCLVKTNLTANAPDSMFTVQPDYFAKSLLYTVEKERQTHGCMRHDLAGWILRVIPMFLFDKMWKRTKHLNGERRKNL